MGPGNSARLSELHPPILSLEMRKLFFKGRNGLVGSYKANKSESGSSKGFRCNSKLCSFGGRVTEGAFAG